MQSSTPHAALCQHKLCASVLKYILQNTNNVLIRCIYIHAHLYNIYNYIYIYTHTTLLFLAVQIDFVKLKQLELHWKGVQAKDQKSSKNKGPRHFPIRQTGRRNTPCVCLPGPCQTGETLGLEHKLDPQKNEKRIIWHTSPVPFVIFNPACKLQRHTPPCHCVAKAHPPCHEMSSRN
jgi:hypothetical protein